MVSAWRSKQKQTVVSQLEEVVKRLSPKDVFKLRDAIVDIENKSSNVLCSQLSFILDSADANQSSTTLRNYPFGIIVRQLGISVLREIPEENSLVRLETQVNSQLSGAFKLAAKNEEACL